MWRNRRGTSLPPTPVLPEANDRFVGQPGLWGWVTETFLLSGSTLWDTTTVQSTRRYMDRTETGTEELTTNSTATQLLFNFLTESLSFMKH